MEQLKIDYLEILRLFLKKKDYYKPIRIGNLWNDN